MRSLQKTQLIASNRITISLQFSFFQKNEYRSGQIIPATTIGSDRGHGPQVHTSHAMLLLEIENFINLECPGGFDLDNVIFYA